MNVFIKKLIGKLIGKRIVILFDFDGEETLSFERISFSGRKFAYRIWLINSLVYLNEGGSTGGKAYVTGWKYL